MLLFDKKNALDLSRFWEVMQKGFSYDLIR